jgi:2-keto-4-pentenoate hydratase
MSTEDDFENFAYTLLSAREEQMVLGPAECAAFEKLDSFASAYGTVREMTKIMSSLGKPVGWKCGATAPHFQKNLRISKPFVAPLFEKRMFESPLGINAIAEHVNIVEAEFAVVMGSSLPPRDVPYVAEDLWKSIALIAPAIEIVGSRFSKSNTFQKVADGGSNVSCSLGPFLKAADCSRNLDQMQVQFLVNGKEVARGSGANVLEHPINSLVFLANELVQEKLSTNHSSWGSTVPGLQAGDIVMTGAASMLFIGKDFLVGDTIVAKFGDDVTGGQSGLGHVTVHLNGGDSKL